MSMGPNQCGIGTKTETRPIYVTGQKKDQGPFTQQGLNKTPNLILDPFTNQDLNKHSNQIFKRVEASTNNHEYPRHKDMYKQLWFWICTGR